MDSGLPINHRINLSGWQDGPFVLRLPDIRRVFTQPWQKANLNDLVSVDGQVRHCSQHAHFK